MSSGNFIVGYNLSLEGFEKYLKPNLEKEELEVKEFKQTKDKQVLLSLYSKNGQNSLEQKIRTAIDNACREIGEDIKKTPNLEELKALPSQLKKLGTASGNRYAYRLIQVYSEKDSASNFFSELKNIFC